MWVITPKRLYKPTKKTYILIIYNTINSTTLYTLLIYLTLIVTINGDVNGIKQWIN